MSYESIKKLIECLRSDNAHEYLVNKALDNTPIRTIINNMKCCGNCLNSENKYHCTHFSKDKRYFKCCKDWASDRLEQSERLL